MKLALAAKLVVPLLLALLLIGCSHATQKKRLAFVTNNSSDFWTIAISDASLMTCWPKALTALPSALMIRRIRRR